ncbi:TetR/AcrR family transcriptional regulator [Curtobacterium sp. NPDC098951]|uniref:TetR/AcrR family transcriptional regulator n=1 Tax=Curtobacterium sp. NPDC098951 TaxID=3363974 RepID=UPI003802607D
MLEVAASLFARDGLEVSMKAIVRATGLGNSTLYRHYPNRVALAADVLRGPVTAWASAVRAAADSGDDVFASTVRISARHQATSLAIAELVASATQLSADVDAALTGGREAISSALRTAVDAGRVRSDASASDVDLLATAIAGVLRRGDTDPAPQVDRLVDLFLQGIESGREPNSGIVR